MHWSVLIIYLAPVLHINLSDSLSSADVKCAALGTEIKALKDEVGQLKGTSSLPIVTHP